MNSNPQKVSLVLPILSVILFSTLFALGYLFYSQKSFLKVDANQYQMVVFDDGRQYFGHLKNLHLRAPYLSDVYYIEQDEEKSQFTLVKLGSEVEGSEDTIYLNWKKVQFWTNLKPDSQVLLEINKEKSM